MTSSDDPHAHPDADAFAQRPSSVRAVGFTRDEEGPSVTAAESEGARDPRLGMMLGPWRLDGKVGDGRAAAVYIATQFGGERAAVKIMHARFKGDEVARRRLLREASIARRLSEHRAVTRVMEADVTKAGEPFVVMERLYGRDLDRLRDDDGRLPVRLVLATALEVLDLLEWLHPQGIVHRNLSPFQIFLTLDGQVKVLDFGAAWVRDEAQAAGPARRGELHFDRHGYLAPEVLTAEAGGDARSDLYSLGRTMLSLLAGQRIGDPEPDPLAEPSEDVLAYADVPPSLAALRPDLDPRLIACIDRATALHPSARFADASAMREAVEATLARTAPSLAHDATERVRSLADALRSRADVQAEMDKLETGAWRSVGLLRDIFRLVENVLYSAKRHGWEHEESILRLEHLVDVILDAIAGDADGIYWVVRPFSFEYLGEAAWSPEPPFDELTYHLFDAGFRKMHLLPGLTDEECRRFLRWLVLDPTRDLPVEDDLATVYWSLEFEHVRCELVSAVVLQDVEDYERLDAELRSLQGEAIEQLRSSVQARLRGEDDPDAVAIEAAEAALVVGRPSAVALDRALIGRLGETLVDAIPLWRGRLAHVLAECERDASQAGDLRLVLDPWSKFVTKALEDGAIEDVLEVFGVVADRARERRVVAAFAEPFFHERALWRLLSVLIPIRTPRDLGADAPFFAGRLHALLRVAPARVAPTVIEAMARCSDRHLLSVLLKVAERHLRGHEDAIGEVLADAEAVLGTNLVAIFGRNPSRESIEALGRAAENPHAKVRMSATEVLARYAPARAMRTMKALLRDPDPSIRLRTVLCMRSNRLSQAVALLGDRIEEREFQSLDLDERKQTLGALYALDEERGEAKLVALVEHHGVVQNDDIDATRTIAVELLAERALSDAALEAVRGAGRRRWWNGPQLQESAQRAAAQIEQRLADLDRELRAKRSRGEEA